MVGTVLNNTYRLDRALTKGGMGQVFVASHLRVSGRRYAIKQLHPELAVTPNFQTRFKREAKVMMALDHPHIVRIEDFLIEGATYYLVMEFVEGNDLDQKLRQDKSVGPQEAHRLTLELLAGLDYCHSKGVIHRDLKPSNLLLDSAGNLKITDFGIALEESSDQRLTNTGTILGTPDYMSPEQIMGTSLDVRSDIYAVGTILYEMLVGQPLYPRTDEQQGSYVVLFSHVHKPPPSIVDPNIPQYLQVVIERCLQKDPVDRYASALDMALAMNNLVGDTYGDAFTQNRWPHSNTALPSKPAFVRQQPIVSTDAFHRESAPLPSGDEFSSAPTSHSGLSAASPQWRASPSTSGKGRWLVLVALLFLVGGVGAWYWPPSHDVLLSWYEQVTGEDLPDRTHRRTPPKKRAGERTVPLRASSGSDVPLGQDAGLSAERPRRGRVPRLQPPSPRDRSQPIVPDTRVTPKRDVPEPRHRRGWDDPNAPRPKPIRPNTLSAPRIRELSKARWPLQVSKQCATLLAICVRHCLKSQGQPTLSFAISCRRRCWKMRRLFKIKGEAVCPSFDGNMP